MRSEDREIGCAKILASESNTKTSGCAWGYEDERIRRHVVGNKAGIGPLEVYKSLNETKV